MMTDWSRPFDAPIPLPNGRALTTLEDAGRYVAALPKVEQKKPHWQTAAGELLTAAERGGFVMLAEIAMRQAVTESPSHHGRRGRRPRRNTGSSDEARF
jgi:hypothetical protein